MPSREAVPPWRVVGAWGVHLFTASGAVVGLLALDSVVRGEVRGALAWMGMAVVIDGVDGWLARLLGVAEATPGFDGVLLDNVVDYLNYVVVPALLMWRVGVLPEGLGLAGAAAVVLASAYQFAQAEAKTPGHFFKGFPSYWNVLALYLLVLGLGPGWNLAIVAALCAGVFVPLRWVYPTRMRRWRGVTLVATVAWGGAVAAIVWRYPSPPRWLVLASLAYVVYYVGVSLWLSLGPAPAGGD